MIDTLSEREQQDMIARERIFKPIGGLGKALSPVPPSSYVGVDGEIPNVDAVWPSRRRPRQFIEGCPYPKRVA